MNTMSPKGEKVGMEMDEVITRYNIDYWIFSIVNPTG